jgi:hypothetical protein
MTGTTRERLAGGIRGSVTSPTDSPADLLRSPVAVMDQSGLAKDQVVIADMVLDLQRDIVTWHGLIDVGVVDLQ